jgi:hypothetical protein
MKYKLNFLSDKQWTKAGTRGLNYCNNIYISGKIIYQVEQSTIWRKFEEIENANGEKYLVRYKKDDSETESKSPDQKIKFIPTNNLIIKSFILTEKDSTRNINSCKNLSPFERLLFDCNFDFITFFTSSKPTYSAQQLGEIQICSLVNKYSLSNILVDRGGNLWIKEVGTSKIHIIDPKVRVNEKNITLSSSDELTYSTSSKNAQYEPKYNKYHMHSHKESIDEMSDDEDKNNVVSLSLHSSSLKDSLSLIQSEYTYNGVDMVNLPFVEKSGNILIGNDNHIYQIIEEDEAKEKDVDKNGTATATAAADTDSNPDSSDETETHSRDKKKTKGGEISKMKLRTDFEYKEIYIENNNLVPSVLNQVDYSDSTLDEELIDVFYDAYLLAMKRVVSGDQTQKLSKNGHNNAQNNADYMLHLTKSKLVEMMHLGFATRDIILEINYHIAKNIVELRQDIFDYAKTGDLVFNLRDLYEIIDAMKNMHWVEWKEYKKQKINTLIKQTTDLIIPKRFNTPAENNQEHTTILQSFLQTLFEIGVNKKNVSFKDESPSEVPDEKRKLTVAKYIDGKKRLFVLPFDADDSILIDVLNNGLLIIMSNNVHYLVNPLNNNIIYETSEHLISWGNYLIRWDNYIVYLIRIGYGLSDIDIYHGEKIRDVVAGQGYLLINDNDEFFIWKTEQLDSMQ